MQLLIVRRLWTVETVTPLKFAWCR